MDQREKRIYIMDSFKLFDGLKKHRLTDRFISDVMDPNHHINLYRFMNENNIPPEEYKKWAKYSYPSDIDGKQRDTRVMSFIKDAYNMPYVPGSSLKGAIRNCMLNAMLTESGGNEKILSELLSVPHYESRELRSTLNKKSNELDMIFHTAARTDKANNALNSIFQGLRISDSRPIPIEKLTLCCKTDITSAGKENKINIHRECIIPGTVIEFDVTIDKKYFPYDENSLYRFINVMYNNEKSCFLSKFPDIQPAQGNLLYIGGGSGFVSKTAVYSLTKNHNKAVELTKNILNMQFKVKHKNDIKVSPHMRKCTKYKMRTYDFGLCRVDFQLMT